MLRCLFVFLFISCSLFAQPIVKVGIEQLFTEPYCSGLKQKKIGLITNHTAVNSKLNLTVDIIKSNAKKYQYALAALFAPEHGLRGDIHAEKGVEDAVDADGIPVYSLHGKTKRPTDKMLQGIDLLIYDIQDIGSRSYTYITTLFYVMEEAAKKNIEVVVLDRPNPINGLIIDGPMLEEKWRSIVGYINVPYCHGMTIGELARFFNGEYKVNCKLTVVPMKGWRRSMTFADTKLPWIPTSPNIPEPSSPHYYPCTGILGELQIVNIGIGYTLPFKLIGAPWIEAEKFAENLNRQKFPGVYFQPFFFKPFYGRFAQEECQGVYIIVTDPLKHKPVSTQYLIIGILKSMYPEKFKEALESAKSRKDMFNKVNGTEEVYKLLLEENHIVWKLKGIHQKERDSFEKLRKKYLLPDYEDM